MNDITQQNINFVSNQYKKQHEVIEIMTQLKEGRIITIVGENGAGKTIYASLTSPFDYTIYFNFETNGSARIASALGEAGLIKYMVNINDLFNNLTLIYEKKYPVKVIVIDSFKEMINHFLDIKFQGKNSQDFHLKIANEFIGGIRHRLQELYKKLNSIGISIVQLCGINDFDNKEENPLENLQCYVKSGKDFVRSYSNHMFVLRNKKRQPQFSLAKDNGGFLDYSYEEFFKDRNIICNNKNESPEDYKGENVLVPYGITNILYNLAKKQLEEIQGFKKIVKFEKIQFFISSCDEKKTS